MSDLKTIAVESATKNVLVMLKQHPRETFDDVIRRLVNEAANAERREEAAKPAS